MAAQPTRRPGIISMKILLRHSLMTSTGSMSASSTSHYPSSLSSNWCAHPFIAVPSPQPISLSQNFGQLVSTQPTTPPASVPEFLSSSSINDRTQYRSLSQNLGQLLSSGLTLPPTSLPQLLCSSPSTDHNQYPQQQRTTPTHYAKKKPWKKKERTKVSAPQKRNFFKLIHHPLHHLDVRPWS